jgi:hypothetical protein
LLDQSRLTDLAGTRNDVQEPARLREPFGKDGGLGAPEVSLFFPHDVEYFYSIH